MDDPDLKNDVRNALSAGKREATDALNDVRRGMIFLVALCVVGFLCVLA